MITTVYTESSWNPDYPIEAHPAFTIRPHGLTFVHRLCIEQCEGAIIMRKLSLPGADIYHCLSRPFPFDDVGNFSVGTGYWNTIAGGFNNIAALYCDSVFSFTADCPERAEQLPFGTFIVNLQLDEGTLWNNLHAKHRNVIRRAEREGLHLLSGEQCLYDSYKIYLLSQKRSGNNYISSRNYFDLYRRLYPHIEVFAVYKNNDPVASSFIPFANRGAIYLYGGVIDHPPSGASNFLHWKTILQLKMRRIRYYDFFGVRPNPEKNSKYEGLYRFKERFGGEYHSGVRWRLVNKPAAVFLFEVLKKLKTVVRR